MILCEPVNRAEQARTALSPGSLFRQDKLSTQADALMGFIQGGVMCVAKPHANQTTALTSLTASLTIFLD